MDFTSVQDKLEFVKSQCRTLPGAKFHEDYTMIRCPFHSDKNPSGRINHSVYSRSPGFFKCYGCGATATWNELAPLIGCTPFKSKPAVRGATIKSRGGKNAIAWRQENYKYIKRPNIGFRVALFIA